MFRPIISLVLILTALWSVPCLSANTDAIEQLDFANGLFARRMYKMAIEEYDKFVKAYPQEPQISHATFMIGESFFYMKDYQSAIDAYRKYLNRFSRGPEVERAQLRIAAAYLELKNYEEALNEAAPFLWETTPNDIKAEALYVTGLTKIASGDKPSGIEDLKAAYQTGKPNLYSYFGAYQLGRLDMDDAKPDAAMPFFGYASQSPDRELSIMAKLGLAQAYFEKHDLKESSTLFREVAFDAATPPARRDQAVTGLIRSLIDARQFVEAAAVYEKTKNSFQSLSSRLDAALLAAQAYTSNANYNEAINTLDPFLEKQDLTEDERESAIFGKVGVLMAAGRIDDANALLSSRKNYKNVDRSLFLKAELNYYSGSSEKALVFYDDVLNNYKNSRFMPEVLYGRAFAALAEKEKKKARDSFAQLAVQFPGDKHAEEALYSAVVLDNELGLKEEGVVDAKSYLEHFSGNKNARAVLLILGRFYTDMKKMDDAIKVYQEFVSKFPDDQKTKEVNYLLGFNFEKKGDPIHAREYYSKVVKTEGDGVYYLARKNIAQTFIEEGNDLAGAKMLEEVMATWPENDLSMDSYLWVIRRYLDSKNFEGAIHVIALAQKRPHAAENKSAFDYFKSEALRGMGKCKEAMAEYKKCIEEDTEKEGYTGAAHLGIGLCLIAAKDLKTAMRSFESAIAFNPADNTVAMRSRYYMGEILFKEGRLDEASKMFMMVAILYDDNSFVPDALYKAVLAFDMLGQKEETRKACIDFLTRFRKNSKAGEVKKILNKTEHAIK